MEMNNYRPHIDPRRMANRAELAAENIKKRKEKGVVRAPQFEVMPAPGELNPEVQVGTNPVGYKVIEKKVPVSDDAWGGGSDVSQPLHDETAGEGGNVPSGQERGMMTVREVPSIQERISGMSEERARFARDENNASQAKAFLERLQRRLKSGELGDLLENDIEALREFLESGALARIEGASEERRRAYEQAAAKYAEIERRLVGRQERRGETMEVVERVAEQLREDAELFEFATDMIKKIEVAPQMVAKLEGDLSNLKSIERFKKTVKEWFGWGHVGSVLDRVLGYFSSQAEKRISEKLGREKGIQEAFGGRLTRENISKLREHFDLPSMLDKAVQYVERLFELEERQERLGQEMKPITKAKKDLREEFIGADSSPAERATFQLLVRLIRESVLHEERKLNVNKDKGGKK